MVIVHTRVRPGSSQKNITRMLDGKIKINLTSPPVAGEANRELIEYFANLLDISKGKIKIKKGKTSSRKIVSIKGVTATEFKEILD